MDAPDIDLVFGSGSDGRRGAYYVNVEADYMAPRYRRGDRVIVAPHDKDLCVGRDFLLSKGSQSRIVRIVSLTPHRIEVRQFHPDRMVHLSRARWTVVGRIFGVVAGQRD